MALPAEFEFDVDNSEEPSVLHVFLMSARDLPAVDKNRFSKASSDPVVTFCVVPGGTRLRDGAEATATSTIKKKDLAPSWNEQFALDADDADDALLVCVDDHDLIGRNDFMGMASLPLRELRDGTCKRLWVKLEDDGGGDAGFRGEVELALRWVHDRHRAVLADPAVAGAEDARPDLAPNVVRVELLRAKGLPIMDKNVLSKGGSSDPVCRLTCGDAAATSSCKTKSLAPVWKEVFDLECEGAATLELTVEDRDLASGNDLMGSCSVPLTRTPTRAWYPLRGEGGAPAGRVEVVAVAVHDPARSLPVPDAMLAAEAHPAEAANALRIHLIRCSGLPAMDGGLLSGKRTSDPLVTFALGGETASST